MTARLLTAISAFLLIAGPPDLAGSAAAAAASAPPGAVPRAEPTVGASYVEARQIAAKRRVPVLLEFYADW